MYLVAPIFFTILLGFIPSIIIANSNDTQIETTGGSTNEDRPASLFKVGDEWLSLPEVFSNLDFDADSTFAADDDIEGQIQLRSTRFWGRIYIDGWPQTIQYFRAHFGIEPPLGRKRFVFAEPRDACSDLTNADLLTENHILFVHRGSCTFGTKARNAAKTKASGIIVINNEPGIDHLPGPDAHDIHFSVSAITQQEGQLLEAVYDDGPAEGGFGRKLEGYVVPINCAKSGAKCNPATVEERNAIGNLVEGGTIQIYREGSTASVASPAKDFPIEYLLSFFGTKSLDASSSYDIAVAKPAEACTPIENDIRGKIVLVRRGSCPFVKKAEEIQAAGGRAMIVGNSYSYIVRMGVEPRWKGLNTVIPVVMVSKRAYSLLVAESYTGGKISFAEDTGNNGKMTVNGEVWELIEKLHKGEGWPRSDAYVTKKYEELVKEHQDWPDRLTALKEAYERRMKEVSGAAKLTGDSPKSDL